MRPPHRLHPPLQVDVQSERQRMYPLAIRCPESRCHSCHGLLLRQLKLQSNAELRSMQSTSIITYGGGSSRPRSEIITADNHQLEAEEDQ